MSPSSPTSQRQKNRMLIWGGFVLLLVGVGFFAVGGIEAPSPEKRADLTARFFVHGTIKIALEFYQKENGEFPSTSEGLLALLKAPAGKEDKWKGPYLELTPPDKMTADP